MNGPETSSRDFSFPATDRGEQLDKDFSQPDDGLGSLSQAARTKNLKTARITMYVIGAITLVVNLGLAAFAPQIVESQFKKEISDLQAQGMTLDMEQVEAQKAESILGMQLAGAGFAALGAIFFVLGAFVYKYPVPCTVLALVLYIAGQAMTALADPTMLARGIVIKVIIIVALVKSIQAAVAYQRERAATGA